MPCGDADVVGEEAVFGAVVARGAAWLVGEDAWAGAEADADSPAGRCTVAPEAPAADAWEIDGVVRGGAIGVGRGAGSVRIVEVSLASGTGSEWRATLSAGRGGASRSSSRAAAGAVAGLRPESLDFRDRRLIRGFPDAGLSKLNSADSELDSG